MSRSIRKRVENSKEGAKMNSVTITKKNSRESRLTLVESVSCEQKKVSKKLCTCEGLNKYDKAFSDLTKEEMEILVELLESK